MNITHYLPSRKIRISIIVLLVIIISIGIYFLVPKKDNSPEAELIDVSLVDPSASNDLFIDSDNDGAYDWEEALWPGLDPNNPDSDGDGVLDGRYIDNKRAIAERQRQSSQEIESNLTQTQQLAQGIGTAILAILESGGELEGQTQEQFEQNISQYINNLTLGETLYTRDRLSMVEDSQENGLIYKDQMIKIFTQYPVAAADFELIINAVNNPEQYRSQVRLAHSRYGKYINDLATLDVPQNIAARHTQLLNSVSQIHGALENLGKEPEDYDELVSLSFISQTESLMNTIAETIFVINNYFELVEDDSLFEPIREG